jgi:hypothetical protein
MPDKHINELPSILQEDITNTKLWIIGDPDTGTLYKATIAQLIATQSSTGSNHIISQTYIRSAPASSNTTVADIQWAQTIPNQPIKIEVSGHFAGVAADTVYNITGVLWFGLHGVGFTYPVNSGTSQQGTFKLTMSLNPAGPGNSYYTTKFEYGRDDDFTGFNEIETGYLDNSNIGTAINDLGVQQLVIFELLSGISLQNCVTVVSLVDTSL